MTKLEIAWSTFEMEEVSQRFLQKYLDRVTDFVRKNSLDEDLYQDILQRLADKLNFVQTNNWNITEKDCINIINQIWEPEDIFSDIDSSSSIKWVSEDYKNTNYSSSHNLGSEKRFYEEMIENWWARDLDNALILWVSNVLAEKSWLNVWIIRLLFLIFFFVGGISFWIYLLLWVSLPIKWVNYWNKTAYQYFTYQIFSLKLWIKNWVKNISGVLRVWINYLMKILTILFNNLWPIIRFFIFIWFGFLFWL